MLSKRFHTACLLLIAMLSGHSHAQTRKEIDSLLKSGTFEVYENPDKAIAIGKRVFEAKASDINRKINGLIMVSDAYSSKRDYRKSLEYVIKAKSLSQQTDNVTIRIKLLTKTAIQYQQLKIYDKAIESLDEALEAGRGFPQDSIQFLIGNNYTIRGFIYKEQFNCDIAIDYFNKGIERYKRNESNITHANLSIVTYNKGNCYIQLSDYEAAKKSFNESLVYAKSIDAKSLQAFALKGLAEVHTLEGQYSEAIKILTEAEAISTDVGDLILNQGIYKGLSENYLAVNEWVNYRKFQQRYLETQQKIKISERKSVGDSLQELEKIQQQKLSELKIDYIFAILLVIVLTFLAVVLFVIYDKKGKKKIAGLQQNIKELQSNVSKTVSGANDSK